MRHSIFVSFGHAHMHQFGNRETIYIFREVYGGVLGRFGIGLFQCSETGKLSVQ
jgi:hypothetical protein